MYISVVCSGDDLLPDIGVYSVGCTLQYSGLFSSDYPLLCVSFQGASELQLEETKQGEIGTKPLQTHSEDE